MGDIMDYELNRKYKKIYNECKKLGEELNKYLISKFSFGHNYSIRFSSHFTHRCVDRDIPLSLVYNTMIYLFHNYRLEFKKYEKHYITAHNTIFVLFVTTEDDNVKIDVASVLDKERHGIDKDLSSNKIKISLDDLSKNRYAVVNLVKVFNFDKIIDKAIAAHHKFVEAL
jgi:hypothetical protein